MRDREREITIELLRLLNDAPDTEALVRSVTGLLQSCSDCDGAILRWKDDSRLLRCETHRQEDAPAVRHGARCVADRDGDGGGAQGGWRALECLCGRMLRGERGSTAAGFTRSGSFWTNDMTALESPSGSVITTHHCRAGVARSMALVPLRHGDGVLGVFELYDRKPGRFDSGCIAFLENVAGQTAIALAQREATARLRHLKEAVDQAAEMVLITGTDGAIEYVNPAFERTTGYAADEVMGLRPSFLRSGQHDEAFYRAMVQTIHDGRVWSGRMVNRRKDGTLFTEECTIAPVRDHHGRIERFVAVRRDVSREIDLEAQIRQAQKLESVGRLAAGVAHDLNNLLSPILGYAELLQREVPDVGPLEEIRHAAERSRDLVRQLLAFARKQVLETRLLDLRGIATGMERLLRPTLREDIDLRFLASAQPCAAVVDKGQVEQVLMNLVVNAQDAMPKGGTLTITVGPTRLDEEWCSEHPGATPGNYVCLRVSDTGCGMTPEVRAQVFEPFFTTKGMAGTGLGLSTVYGIVSQHGGCVLLDSEVDRGTAASVYFPAASEAPPAAGTAPPAKVTPKGSEVVLVVEDNQQVRRLAVLILQQHGYRVETAASGPEALALVEGGSPIDLLLTDVVMPGMNGRELHGRLLQVQPALRALFMSGYTPDVLGHQGVLDEGIAFLRKPFTVSELATKVREVLDQP